MALGQGWERQKLDSLVAEGLASYPNYYDIYFKKIYFLQPRWYGEDDEWLQFVTSSADKMPTSEGDRFYARMVCRLDQCSLYNDLYQEFNNISEDRVKRGMQSLCAEYPQSFKMKAIFGRMLVEVAEKEHSATKKV